MFEHLHGTVDTVDCKLVVPNIVVINIMIILSYCALKLRAAPLHHANIYTHTSGAHPHFPPIRASLKWPLMKVHPVCPVA